MLVLDEADEMLNKGETNDSLLTNFLWLLITSSKSCHILILRKLNVILKEDCFKFALMIINMTASLLMDRFQGADLWGVSLPATGHTGAAGVRHTAARDPGDDQQVHDRPHQNPGQTVRITSKFIARLPLQDRWYIGLPKKEH